MSDEYTSISEAHDNQNPAGPSVRKKVPLWKILLSLGAVLLFMFGLLVWACLFREIPLEISKETTYITEPLTEDGKRVDYFRAIEQHFYVPEMTTDENGYRLIVRAIGSGFENQKGGCPPDDEDLSRQIYEKLGLDPNVPPTMKYRQPYDFIRDYVAGLSEEEFEKLSEPVRAEKKLREELYPEEGEEFVFGEEEGAEEEDVLTADDSLGSDPSSADSFGEGGETGDASDLVGEDEELDSGYPVDVDEVSQWIEGKSGLPWTAGELPMMRQWVEENSPALDVVAEAVRKPHFIIPLAREDEDSLFMLTLLPDVQLMRSLARGLLARANYRLGEGDIDGAIDDIVTCKLLGRQCSDGGTFLSALVGIAIEGISGAIGPVGNPETPITKEQLQRYVDAMKDLPPRMSMEKAIEYERYGSLDAVQAVACGRLDIDGLFSGYCKTPLYTKLPCDWNTVMERFNENFDAFLADYTSYPEPDGEFSVDYLLLQPRSQLMGDYFFAILASAFDAMEEAIYRSECADNLRRITLAMLLYEKDHGTLPPAWTVDDEGSPLHSWRVLLLPYLGEEELYAKIRLDEPWDSEHNRQFHDTLLSFYQCPSAKLSPGETTYTVVVGEKTAFRPGEGKKLADFGPNSRTLILVSESTNPVNWMDPASEVTEKGANEGISISASSFGRTLGSKHPGGANIGMRSGAVQFISEVIDMETLQSLLEGTCDHDDW